jgi:predicted nucleic acid-binding protein
MAYLVDTSVWSLAYRRDSPSDIPEVVVLRGALTGGEQVVIAGIVLLELLRGFVPERVQAQILAEVGALPLVEPTRDDYVNAARWGNVCRQAGVQLPSIDALIAQLCIREDLTLLTTDQDFRHAAHHIPLRVWGGA